MARYLYLIVLIPVLFGGCSPKMVKTKTTVFFPAAPDTARIQYFISYTNSLDITGKRSAIQESVLGEDKGKPIGKPYGITTIKGKVFVCDAAIRGLEIIDVAKKTFTQFVPEGNAQFKLPINCQVTDDHLYVTDVSRNEVLVFDDKFNLQKIIGKSNAVPEFKPMDVCVAGKKIFITNAAAHQVVVYEIEEIETAKYQTGDVVYKNVKENFSFRGTFPDTTRGTDEYLFNPINISYCNGKIYVTDFGDFKVKIFTEAGEYLGSVGQYGNSIGQFVRPKGTSVDRDDNLFVVDAGFENVQLFNKEGKLLMHFGGPYKGPGDMWLPAKVHIDYDNVDLYRNKVAPGFELLYLVWVTNQYGPDKVSVYGAIKPK